MMRTRSSDVTTVLTWIGLGILAVLVALGVIGVAQTAQSLADQFPEFAHLRAPLLGAVVAFGACLEALLLVTAVLVGFVWTSRILHPSALRLVDALVVIVLAAVIPFVVALFNIPGPPALALAIMAGILIEATIALVLLVLRSLLRRAIAMRNELDEVV